MSIPKVVGIEQEYAISVKGGEPLSPFHASCFLVNAYARELGLRDPGVRILWDYGHETPYRDIRGELFGKSAGPEMLAQEENLRINSALPNGARFYTDHAHPEYSTPECLSAKDVVACDKAGERILTKAVQAVRATLPDTEITLLKNNVDHQGHSYGSHENYLVEATSHEECFVRTNRALQTLVPFLVTRSILAGAGKVGGEAPETKGHPFQLSQRADYLEAIFGLETMYARPIVNTRQEHHADDRRFRRLHLILGDANMCDCAALLKIGSTQLVLQMMEDGFLPEDLALKDPVKAVKQVSADFASRLELADGRFLSALDIQRTYLEKAQEFRSIEGSATVPDTDWILGTWDAILGGLESLKLTKELYIADDPAGMVTKLDWVLKLWLLNRHREEKGGDWSLPNLRLLDLQYHNISPGQSIFAHLQSSGMAEKIIDENQIDHFVTEPPTDTRAYFRGKCIEKFPRELNLVNWEVVGFDHGNVNRLVPLLDPMTGAQAQVQGFLDSCRDSRDLVSIMQSAATARRRESRSG